LIGAVTTDSSWGQAFTYDGFGNRTSASVTKGSAPYGNWNYDPATNRLTGYSSDANGNMTSTQSVYGLSYDVENRLVSVPTSSNPEQYAYAPDNKRIWRRKPDGTEELYYYGISGQKLVTITPLVAANGDFFMTTLDTNLYFGSRTIVSRGVTVTLDRVGSNRAGGSRYFPYGEEQQVTAQDRDKFATYYRDSTTGLDYAQNRYYANTLGRFTSPDPFKAAGVGVSDPQSWNQYSYTRGDPVNRMDPAGLDDCDIESGFCDPGPDPGPNPGPVPGPDPFRPGGGGQVGGGQPPPGPYSAPTWMGFDKQDGKTARNARNLAQSWVDNSSKCDHALQSYGVKSLSDALGKINFSGDDQNVWNGTNSTLVVPFSTPKGTVTETVQKYFAANKTSVGAVVINTIWGYEMFLGSAFFDPQLAGVKSGYNSQAQALIMLHEAVHLLGFGDATFGGSKQLTGLLIDNCYPVLKPYLGGLTQ
jgi:RHS repeat-associated protein